MSGDSLQERLDSQGPMQPNEILRIGMQIAAGLAAAHSQGLVHRDIKPGNILLDKGVERVTITDFGLAQAADDASLTRSGVIAGTPQYMSPEQARGEPLDSRSDLFSLGSVLYAMCTGRPPFRAQTAFGVLQRISESLPTAIRQLVPEMPEWLCEIIVKLHAKDPGERFQSAGEVTGLLSRWLAHIQQPTIIPAPPRTSSRSRCAKRLRRVIATVGIGIIGFCLTGVLLYWLFENAKTGLEKHTLSDRTTNVGTEHSDNFSVQAILDERVLHEDCQALRQRISQIESEWSQPSSPVDSTGWESTVSELHRRLDNLDQQIDHNLL